MNITWSWGCVCKNLRPCKNGRNIFRPYISFVFASITGGTFVLTILIDLIVIQTIFVFLLKTCVYKNLHPCKNGRKIFRPYISSIFAPTRKDARRCKNGRNIRPYNFNRFDCHSDDFNFSVKDACI